MNKIIGVHGLNEKPAEDILTGYWREAIDEGLSRNLRNLGPPDYKFDLFYWAGLMGHSEKTLSAEEKSRYVRYPVDGPLPEFEEGFATFLREKLRATGGFLADGIGGIFGREALSPRLLLRKFPDLFRYYHDETLAAQLRDEFRKKLMASDGHKLIILAHSMGSIIAMDTLRGMRDERIGTPGDIGFFSIGSPLGLPYVIYRQKKEFGASKTPDAVGLWINFSDLGDKICFDAWLDDDYAANDQGLLVQDEIVENTFEGNEHEAYGYLRTPELSRAIRDFFSREARPA